MSDYARCRYKQANPQPAGRPTTWETEIDCHIYALCDLTAAEIAIVAGQGD